MDTKKTFSEVNNQSLVESLMQAAEIPNPSLIQKTFRDAQEYEYDRVKPGWCCQLARRFKRVTTKEGISMRVFFCPRCGREL